ncbi:MAG: hypothetical protein WBE90_21785, partial [Xanthobacteraceae bacterium]
YSNVYSSGDRWSWVMVRSNRIDLPQLRQSGGCRAVVMSSRWPGVVTGIPMAAYWEKTRATHPSRLDETHEERTDAEHQS